jgi:tape measure domain-containing protein
MADARQKLVIDVVAKNTAALGGVASGLNSIKASALGAGTALRALGPLLAVIVTGKVIKDIVTTNARFEDLRTTLSTVTGSAQNGAKAFDQISKFATKTQFGVEDLTTTYIKLATSGIEPTEKLLTTFSNAAAVTTDQVGTLSALTDVYTRSLASGQVELQEFDKLQDRGLPVYDILKQKLGVTRNELGKFSKETGNTELILRTLSQTIEERYGDATANLLQNTSTKFSNLGIALKNVADRMGNEFGPSFKDGIDQVTEFVEANEELVAGLGTFIGSTIGLVVKGMGKVITLFFKAVGQVRDLYNAVQEFFLNNQLNDGIQKVIDLFTEFGGKVLNLVIEALRKTSRFLRAVVDALLDVGSAIGKLIFKEKEQLILDDQRIENLRLFHEGYQTVTEDIKENNKAMSEGVYVSKTMAMKQKEMNQVFKKTKVEVSDYEKELNKLLEEYSLNNIAIGTLIGSMRAFASTTESALTDVIMGSKSLKEALGEIGQAILRELIGGFIRLVIVGPILQKIAKIFNVDMVNGVLNQANAQAKLNTELKRTIGLKLLLMLLGGAADGGAIGYGNSKGKANGGAIGYRGARAMGGNVGTGGAYLVGERGPELFVPNTAGTVVSNEASGRAMGGEVIVNFNINAVDAAGFDSLLASRRGLITNLISDAMNRQGRRFA